MLSGNLPARASVRRVPFVSRMEPSLTSGFVRTAGKRPPKCALIDLSGTLHVEDEAIPGAQEALKRLRHFIPHVRFVTNTTKESKRLLHERLNKLGFEIDRDEIFTSLTAARSLLEKKNSKPLLLVDDDAMEDFAGFDSLGEKDCVVVGLAPEKFDYDHMNRAFRTLQRGASLIAIHKARYYKRKDGLALGPGPFVTALEFATGVKAEVCGKPEKSFFLAALDGTDCSPQDAVMIGDDVRDDVLGAQQAGLTGVLVRTGKYVKGDEENYGHPEACVDDFPGVVDLLYKWSQYEGV